MAQHGMARHSIAWHSTADTSRIEHTASLVLQSVVGQGTFQDVPGSRASDSTVAVMPRHGSLLIPPPSWLVCTCVIAEVDEVQPT